MNPSHLSPEQVQKKREEVQQKVDAARAATAAKSIGTPVKLKNRSIDEATATVLPTYGYAVLETREEGKMWRHVCLPLVGPKGPKICARVLFENVEPIPESSIVWHMWNRQNIEGIDIFNEKNVVFSRKNIATLDGIELLSNLQSLDLGENEITS